MYQFRMQRISDMLRPRYRTVVSKHLVLMQIPMQILTTYNKEHKCPWHMLFARLEANRMDVEPPVLLRITTSLRPTTLPIRGTALLPLLPTFSPSEAPGQQVLHRKPVHQLTLVPPLIQKRVSLFIAALSMAYHRPKNSQLPKSQSGTPTLPIVQRPSQDG